MGNDISCFSLSGGDESPNWALAGNLLITHPSSLLLQEEQTCLRRLSNRLFFYELSYTQRERDPARCFYLFLHFTIITLCTVHAFHLRH
jgi:hypothetical protein